MKHANTYYALTALFFVASCAGGEPGTADSETGSLAAALSMAGPTHDVTAIHFVIVAEEGTCDDEPLAETTAVIETESLPTNLLPSGSGDEHAFADGLFILPPGEYRICATPLQEDGEPSEECAPTEGTASVISSQVNEVVLISQCGGAPGGGLDVVVALNDPPQIDDLTIEESKFITTCETATITVTASDVNGDELTYSWLQVSGPVEGTLIGNGATATFTTGVEGDYDLQVTVTDSTGAATALTFPIHVSGDECEPPPPEVCQDGRDPMSGDAWVVCAADEDSAWISAQSGGGIYHPQYICEQLGYSGFGAFGGNCDSVCGYCDGTHSCEDPGQQVFDGNGNCGSDELGQILCITVTWECID